MPTQAELIELRDVLLEHAIAGKRSRQHQVLEFIFNRILEKGEDYKILAQEITELPYYPGEKEPKDKNSTYGMKRELGHKLDDFYGEGRSEGKVPHRAALRQKYRAQFGATGNYSLVFPPYNPKHPEPNLVPYFWRPHLSPLGTARILYPEPVFLIDERQTYFRNAAMGTKADVSALAYLKIPGELKTGYSYVPSGIVQGMLMLAKTLRSHERERADYLTYEAVKPYVAIPPGDKDIILLATPSSTKLVHTLQSKQEMIVDSEGVHNNGEVLDDDEHTQWGVLTRTWQSHRIVTMLAAKHGRSVEAMAKYLTLSSQLALLWQRMGRFPETFQALFRIQVTSTPEGPAVVDTVIEDASNFGEEPPETDKAPGRP
jgi:hypothetical protein